MAVTCVACLPLLDVRRVGRGNQSAQQPGLGENNTSSIFHKSAPLVRVVMETNASQSRHMRENSFYWLGESKSSCPLTQLLLWCYGSRGIAAHNRVHGVMAREATPDCSPLEFSLRALPRARFGIDRQIFSLLPLS